jgi:hypothetical protein
LASETIAESVSCEIASAESVATSEIVTTPIVCEAGMSDVMATKLMRSAEMA